MQDVTQPPHFRPRHRSESWRLRSDAWQSIEVGSEQHNPSGMRDQNYLGIKSAESEHFDRTFDSHVHRDFS
jgi:hypothetical protein